MSFACESVIFRWPHINTVLTRVCLYGLGCTQVTPTEVPWVQVANKLHYRATEKASVRRAATSTDCQQATHHTATFQGELCIHFVSSGEHENAAKNCLILS